MFDPNAPPPSDRPSEPAYTPPPYTAPPAYTPPAYTPPPAPPVYPATASTPPVDPRASPQDYRTAGLFLLFAGITTTICGLGVAFGMMFVVCLGLCWTPLLVFGVFTIVTGARASGGQRVRSIRLVNAFALIASFFCCDPFGFVLNILALIWLAKDDVSRWLEARP